MNLVVTDPDIYFTRHPLYITTPVVSDSCATVMIQAEIAAPHYAGKTLGILTTIRDSDGKTVYKGSSELTYNPRQKTNEYLVDSVTISNPRLWDCESRHLYTVETSIVSPDGRITDSVDETFGIRSIEFSPEFGMKLNGRKLLLKGIANHHTLGALGAAAYPKAIEKRIKLLKEFG